MRPDPLPVLKGKCASVFEKNAAKPLTKKQLSIFQKAREVFDGIKEL